MTSTCCVTVLWGAKELPVPAHRAHHNLALKKFSLSQKDFSSPSLMWFPRPSLNTYNDIGWIAIFHTWHWLFGRKHSLLLDSTERDSVLHSKWSRQDYLGSHPSSISQMVKPNIWVVSVCDLTPCFLTDLTAFQLSLVYMQDSSVPLAICILSWGFSWYLGPLGDHSLALVSMWLHS